MEIQPRPSPFRSPNAKISSSVTRLTHAKPPVATRSNEIAVPMLDFSRQYAQIRDEVLAAIERVCDSQHYILGGAVTEFERRAAEFIGATAVGCASGTDAIFLALAAARIGPGDEVLTTPFSFFATASSITRVGGRPVFADVDPLTLNLDPKQVERFLDGSHPRLKAIMPVHLYGLCTDMDEFLRLGKEAKLTIVEDAAQAFGAAWRGRRAGSIGDLATFSFYPTKNLSAYGDAGCVTTNSDEFAERLRLLRNHGSRKRYYHEEIGWNSRLDSIQAAILSVKLGYIEEWSRRRRERAEFYDHLLKGSGLVQRGELRDVGIRMLHTPTEAYHIYHQYVIRAARRDELRQFLTDRKIGSEIYYPVPLHLQECFQYLGYVEGSLPEAERAAREVVALPMYAEITEEEQRVVVQAIVDFYS
jgi:dTDP-4-amino-4,6-dideoxygalactose transaminase